jgi:hypothetical protein
MAAKKGVLLSSVNNFPPHTTERLAELWITTAEELVGAAVQEGGLTGLANFTGVPEDEMTRLVNLALAALPPGVDFAPGDVVSFAMGALDEREPGQEEESPPSFAPLPPSADLRSRFGPVRNQGGRGACVSFACTAVREYLLGETSTQGDFSEQYLYWNCKQHDLIPGSGTFIRIAMQRLLADGICPELIWPYNPVLIPGNESQNPPPAGAEEKAQPYRITASTQLNPTSVDALRETLANGRPVAFAVPVYTHWFTKPTRTTGDIRLPLPGEKLEGGHAMCMVGYETDADTPGGGYFMVRNSWGTDWASESELGAGYARIPFAFINLYANSAFTAEMSGPLPDVQKSWLDRLTDWLRKLFGG